MNYLHSLKLVTTIPPQGPDPSPHIPHDVGLVAPTLPGKVTKWYLPPPPLNKIKCCRPRDVCGFILECPLHCKDLSRPSITPPVYHVLPGGGSSALTVAAVKGDSPNPHFSSRQNEVIWRSQPPLTDYRGPSRGAATKWIYSAEHLRGMLHFLLKSCTLYSYISIWELPSISYWQQSIASKKGIILLCISFCWRSTLTFSLNISHYPQHGILEPVP